MTPSDQADTDFTVVSAHNAAVVGNKTSENGAYLIVQSPATHKAWQGDSGKKKNLKENGRAEGNYSSLQPSTTILFNIKS